MRILYVAKHNSGDNDDEGAIAHGLRELGHEVLCVDETVRGRYILQHTNYDFVLFHKWQDTATLKRLEMPKVFWYFDLVDFPDPMIAGRNRNRMEWMQRTIPEVRVGFCTDGDWVNKDRSGKLVRLLQGADQRIAGTGLQQTSRRLKLLFTGTRKGGLGRESFVSEMATNYCGGFTHLGDKNKIHGRALADVIRSADIVVAPDAPITDHYWSNRVYLMLGFGAFLMHPFASTLVRHYTDEKEIVYYRDREELHSKIKYYSERPEERERIAAAGLRRTLEQHTYKHRCQQLVNILKERGVVK